MQRRSLGKEVTNDAGRSLPGRDHGGAELAQIKGTPNRPMPRHMRVSPAAAVATFRRRVAGASFLGGMGKALLVVAVVTAVAQLGARCLGHHLAPDPTWALLLLPIIASGAWRMRRERLLVAVAAGHLDRRLGLRGLLLCADEAVPLEPAWQTRLDERLALLPSVLPRLRWRQLFTLPLVAVLLATGIALLPPPAPKKRLLQLSALAAEVDRLAALTRDLFGRGEVPLETRQELETKLAELQKKLAAGEPPDWRDVDQLEQRLQREQLLQAVTEPRGKNGAPATGETRSTESPPATPAEVAKAASALAAAGHLDELPPELQAALRGAQRADGTFDPTALPQDMEALRQLAEAMAAAAGKLADGTLADPLEPGQLADLRELLERFGPGEGAMPGGTGAGEGEGEGQGEGEGLGRGGVGRGPGHAALALTEDAQGGADAAMALPPGHAVPTDWVPVGTRRSEPVANPEVSTAPGNAGSSGAGGAAWQLQLAPRHRTIVQRFFDAQTAAPPERGAGSKDKR